MKFLIDNAISPAVAVGLNQAGHDAVHVQTYGLSAATDDVVLARAAQEERVLVSADTDFGTLLALKRDSKPSFILFRKDAVHKPNDQLTLLLDNLLTITSELEQGAVVVIEASRIRVRMLPIGEQ
jgi:predicted nuclease of predicted toxin-antitoxin system